MNLNKIVEEVNECTRARAEEKWNEGVSVKMIVVSKHEMMKRTRLELSLCWVSRNR